MSKYRGLEVYQNDLSIGFIFEIEKTKEYDPKYMVNEDWCYSSTSREGDFNSGEWEKLSNLCFVYDNDLKTEKINSYISNTNKTILSSDDILNIINNLNEINNTTLLNKKTPTD